MNIYKTILKDSLPRLLTLYNLDPCSATFGFGDRLYWGWKISDFPNGTMQGGVHAIAIAIKLGLIENKSFALQIIDAAIGALSKIRAKNGSLSESYPNENSFCVTALVSYDVLAAVIHLGDLIDSTTKNNYLNQVRPLIQFITKYDEQHAIISNHLASAVAAIVLWKHITHENLSHDAELLDIIYKNQSNEGWFKEYEGADPGYQTLCTYFLYSTYQLTEDGQLLESLKRSAEFLKFFVHPDLTMGGLYGSRNTEVYYPAGIVGMSPLVDDFAIIASRLQKGIKAGKHVVPQSIDIGNFIPLINAYAEATLSCGDHAGRNRRVEQPAPFENSFEIDFKAAGIYIRSTEQYYAVVNYKKGGVLKVFNKITNRVEIEDGGIFGVDFNGRGFSTQQFDKDITFDRFSIKAHFYRINDKSPTPLAFIVIRLLSLSFFKSIAIGNLFKKFIVKFLMTGKRKIDGSTHRNFEFTPSKIKINEKISAPRHTARIGHYGKCKSIHMASSGYYLLQDQEFPHLSEIVEFYKQK